jgi:hypothetical protein
MNGREWSLLEIEKKIEKNKLGQRFVQVFSL